MFNSGGVGSAEAGFVAVTDPSFASEFKDGASCFGIGVALGTSSEDSRGRFRFGAITVRGDEDDVVAAAVVVVVGGGGFESTVDLDSSFTAAESVDDGGACDLIRPYRTSATSISISS